jgi:hypothetical protein
MAIVTNFTHSAYVHYFEQIAMEHVDIAHSSTEKHFSRLNINEMIQALNTDINYPCLLLESLEGGLEAVSDDQINDVKTCGFMVVDLADLGDYADQDEVLDKMFVLAMEIVSRMRDDRKMHSWLRRLNLDRVKYFKVGPLFDRAFGYLVEFEIKTQINLTYNPAKWQLLSSSNPHA